MIDTIAKAHLLDEPARIVGTEQQADLAPPWRRLVSPARLKHGTVPVMATKAERRAARERVSVYHQTQLAELLSHVAAARKSSLILGLSTSLKSCAPFSSSPG